MRGGYHGSRIAWHTSFQLRPAPARRRISVMRATLRFSVALGMVLLAGIAPALAAPPGRRPNVLLILVDDLKPALGAFGDTAAVTPKIDELAARGVRFERGYANQAVCAPSRFNLMLGSRSTSTGLYGLGENLRQHLPAAVTLPQHFARHGYRTESLGKVFHVGHGNLGDPQSFSVPHFGDKVIEYLVPASTRGPAHARRGVLRERAAGSAEPQPAARRGVGEPGRAGRGVCRRPRGQRGHPPARGGQGPAGAVLHGGGLRPPASSLLGAEEVLGRARPSEAAR